MYDVYVIHAVLKFIVNRSFVITRKQVYVDVYFFLALNDIYY